MYVLRVCVYVEISTAHTHAHSHDSRCLTVGRYVRRRFVFCDATATSVPQFTAVSDSYTRTDNAIVQRFYVDVRNSVFPWRNIDIKSKDGDDGDTAGVGRTDGDTGEHSFVGPRTKLLPHIICHRRFLHVSFNGSPWSAGVDLERLQIGVPEEVCTHVCRDGCRQVQGGKAALMVADFANLVSRQCVMW